MSVVHLGHYNTSGSRTHVGFQFSTHDAAGGNVAPLSSFEAADIRIYRAGDGAAFSATERSSASGITMTSPFDTLTGVHDVDIDLTDNTDAGFYAAGYRYSVMLCPDTETIDGQTITGVVLAMFEIGPPQVNVTQNAGTAITASSGRQEVNATHVAGSIVSTSSAQFGVNVVQISSDAIAADNAEAFFDGNGYNGANNVIPTVTNLTNLPSIPTNWLTAAGISDDAITAAKLASDVGTEIAAAVWAAVTRTLSAGTNVDGSTFSAIPWNAAWDAEVQSEVADALAAYKALAADVAYDATTVNGVVATTFAS